MRAVLLLTILYFKYGDSKLWPKGVVHYAINQKDYDLHSQDIIQSVFEAMEREVCVKFFHAPTNKSSSTNDRILYISNPNKLKHCPPMVFNYTGTVVDMPIGWKCLNNKDISRIVVDMLRASIDQSDPMTSYDIMKKYRERDHDNSTSLLTPDDRNFINSYYYTECGSLSARPVVLDPNRRSNGEDQSDEINSKAIESYKHLLWPLGVVMYGVTPSLRGTPAHSMLKFAMTSIELSSCIVFQFTDETDVIAPKNLLYFGYQGDEIPEYGFTEGNQSIELRSMVQGAPGHTAHAINNLMRVLGVPMMSNRYDRDNYITINWKNVAKGKEYLLEKQPEESWIPSIPYDFLSVTHAPANFACEGCQLGATTVQPIQDHLWQRTMSMGHTTALTASDIKILNLLYKKECQRRTS
ncbi:astacin (Peptidase family m12A) domain-containing protein [Phthorimaea operculella]|nr:astacin (Peptidase family m12A) domain-containing protein [Phthorimaea operculella]